MFDEIKKLKGTEVGPIMLVASSMCPGIIAIWIYDPALLASSSALKLVVLTLSFTLPYVALNSMFFNWFIKTDIEVSIRWYTVTLPFGCFFSMLMFCPCLAVCYFFDISLDPFLYSIMILEFLYVVILCFWGGEIWSCLQRIGSWLEKRRTPPPPNT